MPYAPPPPRNCRAHMPGGAPLSSQGPPRLIGRLARPDRAAALDGVPYEIQYKPLPVGHFPTAGHISLILVF